MNRSHTQLTRRQMLKVSAASGAALLCPAALKRTVRAALAPRRLTGTIDDAAYRIQVPATWNGTLLLYSHGMVLPGQPNLAMEVSDPITGAALLDQEYALAGSSYSTTGYALEQAFPALLALLDLFARRVGTPARTIAWGDSLGGLVSAGFVQRSPEHFAGALPMCGVLMGGVALWNAFLDIQYAFKALPAPDDPKLQVVRMADGNATLQHAAGIFTAAQQSPAGRARVGLVNALYPTSDAHHPPPPAPTYTGHHLSAQEQARYAFLYSPLGLAFGARPNMEARAGGNPSSNTGVSYRDLFARSPQHDRVAPLYRQAELDLDADLRTLDNAPRIAAEPRALDYLRRYIVFDGAITLPVLTVHTIGDPAMPVAAERAYADAVDAAGKASMLRQLFVDRTGHVLFTAAERLAALAQLVKRIDAGRWDDAGLAPTAMNTATIGLGPALNVLTDPYSGPMAPAFAPFQQPPFARAFDARTPVGLCGWADPLLATA